MADMQAATSDQAAQSAMRRVLDVTELPENVLLYLPLHTLLCSKRVSIRFRDVTNTSLSIRRALFVEPLSVPTDADIASMSRYQEAVDADPSLQHLPDSLQKPIVVNPFLRSFIWYTNSIWHFPRVSPNRYRQSFRLTGYGHLLCEDGGTSTASWRNMLFLQPHAAPFYPKLRYGVESARSLARGLRMSDLARLQSEHTCGNCESAERCKVKKVGCRRVHLELHPGVNLIHMDRIEPQGESDAGAITRLCGWDVLAFGRQHYSSPATA